MERPADINRAIWDTWVQIYNSVPTHRRTRDVPTTNDQANASIAGMLPHLLDLRAAVGAAGGEGERGESRLHFPSDPPSLSSATENSWDTYSQQFEFWAEGLVGTVKPSLCRAAIYQVLSFWKGDKLKEYASVAGASDLVRDTWEETYKALLSWGDARFYTVAYYTTKTLQWENAQSQMKAADYATGELFYLAFDNIMLGYKRVCKKASRPEPTELDVTKKFLTLLPGQVREEGLTFKSSDDPATDFERAPYRTHFKFICGTWRRTNVQVPIWVRDAIPLAKIKRTAADMDSEDSDDEASARVIKQRRLTSAQCILRYMSYSIPKEFTGKLRRPEGGVNPELLRRLVKAGRCTSCRKTKAEHARGSPFDDPRTFPEERAVRFGGVKEEENTPEPGYLPVQTTARPIQGEENS